MQLALPESDQKEPRIALLAQASARAFDSESIHLCVFENGVGAKVCASRQISPRLDGILQPSISPDLPTPPWPSLNCDAVLLGVPSISPDLPTPPWPSLICDAVLLGVQASPMTFRRLQSAGGGKQRLLGEVWLPVTKVHNPSDRSHRRVCEMKFDEVLWLHGHRIGRVCGVCRILNGPSFIQVRHLRTNLRTHLRTNLRTVRTHLRTHLPASRGLS